MKKIYIIFAVIIVFAFLLGFFINKFAFTGQVVSETSSEYTWTKAICNSNQCVDALITCKDGKVAGIEPVSDIYNFENFNDLRGNLPDKLC